MVEYICKATSSMCLIILSLRCTRLCQSVCRRFLARKVCYVLKVLTDWDSTPQRRSSKFLLTWVQLPPYALVAYRQWFGNCRKRQLRLCAKAQKTFLLMMRAIPLLTVRKFLIESNTPLALLEGGYRVSNI